MEKIGYILLSIVAAIYIVAMFAGLIMAFPWGIVGLIAILGVGILFIKVLKERILNKEDTHYSKNIDK